METPVPRNVLRFEVLTYSSLLVDALSLAFLDRGREAMEMEAAARVNLIVIVMLLVMLALVQFAARGRKAWAKWTIFVLFALSTLSLVAGGGPDDGGAAQWADVLSTALAAAGLYCAFTGDARGWFDG